MSITRDVSSSSRKRVSEVVREDGTSRVQIVEKKTNPRYYARLQKMERLSGNGALLYTSMNQRGEPMVCLLTDALNLFYGSGQAYLVLEDLLVTKGAHR